jgi:hypothetical protein
VWTLALDDTQKQLIARLEGSREAWQTTAPFVPERTQAAAVARQMKNMKASMPVAFMAGPSFEFWAFACGALLARAHARSGDAAAIAGYCGDGHTLDRALADFAEAYGDQTERDHAALVQAIKRGRVESAGRPSPVSP